MTVPFRTLNRTVLAGVEATPGVEEILDPATHAVLFEEPRIAATLNTQETNEATGSLDTRGPIPSGGSATFTGRIYLKGADTPGTAPEYGVILRGLGLGQTLSAADVAGTATAGAASTITLDAGTVGADDAFIGMVILLTGGTGSGQRRVISDYDATGKVATVYPAWTVTPDGTSTYSIPANALYRPVSANLENLTFYTYEHHSFGGNSLLRKMIGSAGTATLDLPVGGIGVLNTTFQGGLTEPVDATPPAAPTLQTVRGIPFLDAEVYLGGDEVKLNNLSFDLGNTVSQVPNPIKEFGVDSANITRRSMTGRFSLPRDLVATRNPFASWKGQIPYQFWTTYGAVAGNRVSIYNPRIVYSSVEDEDVEGYAYDGLPFSAQGENNGIFLCLY